MILNKINVRNFKRAATIIWERLRGLNFSTVIDTKDVGYDPDIVHKSEPSGGKDLIKLLSCLSITNKDAIIDIGCGKGSALKSMLNFPFQRVDGIEISSEISEIAKRNFRKLNVDRTQIFVENAIIFEDYKNYNIFYFFNPFPCEIMAEVIVKIDSALEKSEREAIVIYVNPECGDTLMKNSNFTKILATKIDYHTTHIYSNWLRDKTRLPQTI